MTLTPAIRPHLASFETGSFVRPVHRLVWHPVPVPRSPGAVPSGGRPVRGRRLLVVGEVRALVAAVAAALRDAGAIVQQAGPGHEPAAGDWDGIVDLNVAGLPFELPEDGWRDALARTVRMIQHRYADWESEVRSDYCCYLIVTAMGGLMGYRDGDAGQPLGGIWAGLAKCLPRELPNLAVKVVDVADTAPEAVAAIVAAELAGWDLFEIGVRDGVRYGLSARRAPVPPARVELGPDDLVLISGGARGVGFALARSLADRVGCRVVVTGRSPLPDGLEDPEAADAPGAQARAAEVAAARGAAELRAIRARQRRAGELRDVTANLAEASAAGLRIRYELCDVTDAAQVSELFSRVGAPTVVVHNAGVDEPRRLDAKTPEEVVRTVAVKVTGFANLVRQIQAHPARRGALKVFCNVGSLAGRMGGMIGQTDYAAGNEALARLGFWARDRLGLPVQTVCWPTWERLGVIANYDAAVRYVSTIAPADAVQRWSRELAAAHTDEAMFMGQVGPALVPSQLRGFWLLTGHPDLPRLHALAHFLGRVEVFEPFRRIRGTRTYQAGSDPCLGEFRVDGEPAVPVSVLLEHACAVADWVVPPDWPVQHLTELRDVTVHLPRLRFAAEGALTFTTSAEGAGEPDGWTVRVTMTTAAGVAATLSLLYRPEPVTALGEVAAPDLPSAGPPPVRSGRFSWAQLAIGPIRWRGGPSGEHAALLPTVTAADLWTVVFPPSHGIAPAAVEAVVIAATAAGDGTDLSWSRVQLCPGAQGVNLLYRADPGGPWSGLLDQQEVLRFIP